MGISAPVKTPSPPPAVAQGSILLHEQRFRQLVTIGVVVLGVRGLFSIAIAGWPTVAVLVAGMGALLASQWMFRKGWHTAAYMTFVNLMVLMVAALAWVSEGMFDASLMALPAIMLVAGLLLPRRYFIGVVIEVFIVVAAIAFGAYHGWRPREPFGSEADRLIDIIAILAASALAVLVMTRDMRHLITSLRAEVARVERSEHELQRHRDRLELLVAERTAELERRNQELVAQRDEIERLAHHDALTGLPTSRVARDRLRVACNLSKRTKGWIGLMFIDLDGFKAVNDTHGHDAGDHVLRIVAERLSANVRGADTAARQGGDEFIVILNEGVDAERVTQIAERLIATLGEPIDYLGVELHIGASIGIALCPAHASDPEDLFKKADLAMYSVKRTGKNGFALYQ